MRRVFPFRSNNLQPNGLPGTVFVPGDWRAAVFPTPSHPPPRRHLRAHGRGRLLDQRQPLTTAPARWQKHFDDTREGRVKADVRFRFSKRLGDATTAHETGIFRYVSQTPGGEPKEEFIHLVALLVKKPGGWKILMEHQVSPATEAEWDALN